MFSEETEVLTFYVCYFFLFFFYDNDKTEYNEKMIIYCSLCYECILPFPAKLLLVRHLHHILNTLPCIPF